MGLRPFFGRVAVHCHFLFNGVCNRLIGGHRVEGDRLCFGTALEGVRRCSYDRRRLSASRAAWPASKPLLFQARQ